MFKKLLTLKCNFFQLKTTVEPGIIEWMEQLFIGWYKKLNSKSNTDFISLHTNSSTAFCFRAIKAFASYIATLPPG